MHAGGFPIDLILFGMIAAFLVLRLRSILGRRTGYERPAQFQPQPQPGPAAPGAVVIEGQAEPSAPHPGVPDPASALGQSLAAIAAQDPLFQPARFLGQAEQAFRMIVTAFAAGDRAALQALVSPDVFHAFDQAIAARTSAGERQSTEIRAIPTIAIEAADLAGRVARVTLRIVSDQVSLTSDAAGHPVSGTDAVTELTDVWTFERNLAGTDPAWRLAAVRGG